MKVVLIKLMILMIILFSYVFMNYILSNFAIKYDLENSIYSYIFRGISVFILVFLLVRFIALNAGHIVHGDSLKKDR